MNLYYNPEVRLLLINHSTEKVEVAYMNNKFKMPFIGPRPPYYIHPQYEPWYPVV